jgi:hypothetical protein
MESVGEVAVCPVERMRMDVDIVCVGFLQLRRDFSHGWIGS